MKKIQAWSLTLVFIAMAEVKKKTYGNRRNERIDISTMKNSKVRRNRPKMENEKDRIEKKIKQHKKIIESLKKCIETDQELSNIQKMNVANEEKMITLWESRLNEWRLKNGQQKTK